MPQQNTTRTTPRSRNRRRTTNTTPKTKTKTTNDPIQTIPTNTKTFYKSYDIIYPEIPRNKVKPKETYKNIIKKENTANVILDNSDVCEEQEIVLPPGQKWEVFRNLN